MNEVRYVEITPNDEQRLDNYLFKLLKGVPKSYIYRVIRSGEIRVNQKRAKPCLRLTTGDKVRIPPVKTAKPAEIILNHEVTHLLEQSIIFEDRQLIVLNKPAGIAVHGGSGLSLGVIEALRRMRSDLSYLELVHRLDKDTSGCLLIAKKKSILCQLQALLANRCIRKTYWAIAHNLWQHPRTILVNQALDKNILQSGERLVKINPLGKEAETQFLLKENYQQACWLEILPKTGRTHQIRVHSAYLNHPLVGDKKYGTGNNQRISTISNRLYLHACAIEFKLNDHSRCFEAPLDKSFSQALIKLAVK